MKAHSRQAGGGTLFTEPILVVSQQATLVEAGSEFGVFDQHGEPLGSVVEVGQSRLRKIISVLTKYPRRRSRTFEVRDMGGSVVVKVTRPAKVLESRIVVTRADETPIGEIIPDDALGRIRFSFVANGRSIGSLQAENWRAWDFSLTDDTGAEIARVTKTFDGPVKEAFTTTDNYVVEVHRHVASPLACMAMAAALTIDTALRQDEPDT
jgi:scramblase